MSDWTQLSRTIWPTTKPMDPEKLSSAIEFDCPFRVTDAGTIERTDDYAPDVWHSETDDVEVTSDDWRPFSAGYSGQHAYAGPVMHASEQLSGGLARDVLATPGVYVVTVVEVLDDEDEMTFDSEPAGWIVLRKVD